MAPAPNSIHPPETSAVTSVKAAMICDACRQHADIPTEQPPSTIKVHRDAGQFDCNICLDGCHNPVVTHCGHLFCWPCLYSWLSLHSLSQECPVCKANVQDRIVPLYGSGGQAEHSINSAANVEIPCRPSPSRSDVPLATTAVAHHEIHTRLGAASSANVGFFASMLRYGMTPLTVHMRGGFFGEWGRSGAAILERRQWRFGNEKEFVLHWTFIFVASIAIVCCIVY